MVPELTAETRGQIAARVLGTSGTSNPVDAGAAVPGDDLAAIVEAVMASGEVDAVLVELVATSLSAPHAALVALATVRERHREMPRAARAPWDGAPPGGGRRPHRVPLVHRRGARPGSGSALRRLAGRAQRRDRSGDRASRPSSAELLRRRSLAAEILATEAGADGWVGAAAAGPLLRAYGLQAAGGVARGRAEVVHLAESVGFPVVIKVADRDVVHRTERGLVRVGLDSTDAVARAVASFEREMDRTDVPVLVQPVVAGVELAIGVVRDRSLGPLVMVGAGGVATDILNDRVYLVPPVRGTDVRRALRGLRCWPLLEGFRGAAPVDVDSIVELVVSCGRLAEDIPEVAEVDVNPVMVSSAGCALVDVKLRLAANPFAALDEPRQLRRTT